MTVQCAGERQNADFQPLVSIAARDASNLLQSTNSDAMLAGHKNEAHCLFAAFMPHPNQAYVISGSEDARILIWSLNSKKVDFKFSHCV